MHSVRDEFKGRSDRKGLRLLIAGTGGQGVLTATRLLCDYFVADGRDVVTGQLHGMAQRGGSVQATVMVDCGISPVIPQGRADVVLGFEPAETARALPFLSSGALVLMNTTPVIPFTVGQRAILEDEDAGYPEVAELVESIRSVTDRVMTLDATQLARDAGSAAALNITLLGCLLGCGGLPCQADGFWEIVSRGLPASSARVNAAAFEAGVKAGRAMRRPLEQPCP